MSKLLQIPEAALAQHVIALGKTGAGKSAKLRVLVEHLLEQDRPVCIIDPKGDWWGLKSSADGRKSGFPVVIFGGEHADVALNEHAGAHVAELVATGNRSCLIDLGGWMVGERTRFFIQFASALFKHARGARHLVIDEVHNFAPKGKVWDADAGKMLHWANRLASEGRGKGITLIAASQRPQKVHNDFLTSCETLIACRVIHKADRDAIKDWIDGCADPTTGREVLAELAAMKRTEAWVWSPEINFGPARITFPMFKTYDSFKPQGADAGKLKGWAAVDLEEVRAKLAAVVEEAEANDPRALRRRIAELEAEVRTAGAGPSETEIQERVQAIEAQLREEWEAVARERVAEAIGALRSEVRPHVEALGHALLNGWAPPEPSLHQAPEPRRHAQRAQGAPAQPPPPAKSRHASRPRAAAPAEGAPTLGGPHRRILGALAWLETIGVAPARNEAVAFIAGYRPGGGAYENPRGALRTAGLVDYPTPGMLALTAAGRAEAAAPEAPRRLGALHEMVLGKLSGPEQRILLPLLGAYPNDLSSEELAAAAGYAAGGGAYENPRGRLRTLGLIDYPTRGRVVACPIPDMGRGR